MNTMNNTIAMETNMDVTLPMDYGSVPSWQRKAIASSPFMSPQGQRRRTSSSSLSGQKPPTYTRQRGGDRFIPNRSGVDLDVCRFKLNSPLPSLEKTDYSCPSQGHNGEKFRQTLAMNLFGNETPSKKQVLNFKSEQPILLPPPNLIRTPNRVFYDYKTMTNSAKKPYRTISPSPSRILDAPELRDDYYLNLLSWNQDKILAVALNQTVYLWNADTGSISEVKACTGAHDYVTSVEWIEDGSTSQLAVGTDNAEVQIWDVTASKKVRGLRGHVGRVGAMAWNPSSSVLSSGSRDSNIFQHDIRAARHLTSAYRGHHQEVCGLTWSPDGSTLASGGNDNLLCLWDKTISGSRTNQTHMAPRCILSGHQAAVKALAWCPWERNLLASGGGTADRCIKFWNSSSGNLLNSVCTNSQVCGLLWSQTEREILSSHGFSHYQLCLWKYPTMTKVKELKGHTARVLHMAMSPDGSTVVSAAADETLRFWDIFPATNPSTKTCDPGNNTFSTIAGIR